MEVDIALAPEMLTFRLGDQWPSWEEQRALRIQLIADGYLTKATRAIIDIRGAATPVSGAAHTVRAAPIDQALPFQRAYLVASKVQFGFCRQMQLLATPNMQIEIFTDEQKALDWLHQRGAEHGDDRDPAVRNRQA